MRKGVDTSPGISSAPAQVSLSDLYENAYTQTNLALAPFLDTQTRFLSIQKSIGPIAA